MLRKLRKTFTRYETASEKSTLSPANYIPRSNNYIQIFISYLKIAYFKICLKIFFLEKGGYAVGESENGGEIVGEVMGSRRICRKKTFYGKNVDFCFFGKGMKLFQRESKFEMVVLRRRQVACLRMLMLGGAITGILWFIYL